MTLESQIAPTPHGLSIVDDGYRAGTCNIGPAEIAMRRRAGHVALGVAIVALAVLGLASALIGLAIGLVAVVLPL